MKANRSNYEVIITETKSRHWKKVAFDSTVRFDTKVSHAFFFFLRLIWIKEIELGLPGVEIVSRPHESILHTTRASQLSYNAKSE